MREYSRWRKPFAIATWFAEALDALEAIAVGSRHIYLPHPIELPGNHFLFEKRPGDRVDLLPDGFINYVPKTIAPEKASAWPRYLVRLTLEILAARRHGLSYRPVLHGHQTQFELGLYDASWCFNSEGYLTRSGPLHAVPAPARAFVRSSDDSSRTVLFLDQELYEVVDAVTEEAMRRAAIQEIVQRNPARVLYKAHPTGVTRSHSLRSRGLEVVDVTGPTPAEELPLTHRIDCIVGFYSTTLLLVPREVVSNRIAVFPDPNLGGIRRPRLVARMRKPLAASGAQIVLAHPPERTGS